MGLAAHSLLSYEEHHANKVRYAHQEYDWVTRGRYYWYIGTCVLAILGILFMLTLHDKAALMLKHYEPVTEQLYRLK